MYIFTPLPKLISMNAIVKFEFNQISNSWSTYCVGFFLALTGVYCGLNFNLSVDEDIYVNSPYYIGFMIGMLSLSILFFAILFSNQLLFKDRDAKIDLIIFALPLSKFSYLSGKFWVLYVKTFLCFFFLILGFVIGQNFRVGSEMQAGFNAWHYLYPLITFGMLNCLFVCSALFLISYTTQRKLLVVIGGLLIYVFYLVLLVFSNSPFMAGGLPQSIETQQISALLDPFGLSAYFFEATKLSYQNKNENIVLISGLLLINRVIVFGFSAVFLVFSYWLFSFSKVSKKKATTKIKLMVSVETFASKKFKKITPKLGNVMDFKSVISFMKIDLIYLFKSITIVAVSILLLFFIGMEMYAEIEKGIRLPQKFASSGLMATTISQNFHFLGGLVLIYFINDLYWRNNSSGFVLMEKSTFFYKSKLAGHLLSSSILLFFLTMLLIAEAVIFQFSYQYFKIDWSAYFGVLLFNTLPLILFSAFLLLINDILKNRFIALAISTIGFFALASPFVKIVLPFPVLQIFSGYKGIYSDFNGYDIYLIAFSQKLLFGIALVALLWLLNKFIKTKKLKIIKILFVSVLFISGIFSGMLFMEGYAPKNKDKEILEAVKYERDFRKYEDFPQPTITDVSTNIDLYTSKNSYKITGKYILKNQTEKSIDKILINFNTDLNIESATFISSEENIKINSFLTEIKLNHSLKPNETATLNFTLNYKWFAVNGHRPFNAIVRNGSFIRISNYYPSFGYQKNREIEDEQKRTEFNLGLTSKIKKLQDPSVFKRDFINLKMTLSTEEPQTAVGTGDLIEKWQEKGRNYFKYQADNIPFRFAVSSAEYQVKSLVYQNIAINVFYNKNHSENVLHLIKNAKFALDYCIQNFGDYPFKSVNFVEISSFTKGFAATAYPAAIFMAEDMLFHADIRKDKAQDVINELAGHELSHLWWGNSQIDPDDRNGALLLTESLSMYTEMMLYKKIYGKQKMMKRLKVHHQIYDTEKGYSINQPLYKVESENVHIAYSKGAIIMVKLSKLIGEKQVNKALQNFLQNNKYPKKPTSLDLLNEFYKFSPSEKTTLTIDRLFKSL